MICTREHYMVGVGTPLYFYPYHPYRHIRPIISGLIQRTNDVLSSVLIWAPCLSPISTHISHISHVKLKKANHMAFVWVPTTLPACVLTENQKVPA